MRPNRLFGGKREQQGMATALYGAIVAQARNADFYALMGVPDTVSGRFEMVVLHAFLVLARLEKGDAQQRSVGQGVFDLFCLDMDQSLRELGIGDVGVPKRMRQMGEAFYGRALAYEQAITAGDEAGLAVALARNVFKDLSAREGLPLARYTVSAWAALMVADATGIFAAAVPFPEARRFAVAATGAAL